jgi:hypothetical protein
MISAVAGAVGSAKISMSASCCRASSRVRAIATPPIGWDPWVLNAASYISVVKTGTMLGSRFALAVVVGSAGRVRW